MTELETLKHRLECIERKSKLSSKDRNITFILKRDILNIIKKEAESNE